MGAFKLGVVSVSSTVGGAEAHTVALGAGLSDRGHEVHLYGRCPGWVERGLPATDVPLGPKWSKSTVVTGIARLAADRRVARSIPEASAYHLQFKREQVALTSVLARRAPVLWTEHGRWVPGRLGRALLHAYGQAASGVSRVVCVSESVADDLRPVVPREKLRVVSNSIDVDEYNFAPADRRAGRERLLPEHFRGRLIAVLASRLHITKRHERAIAISLATRTPLIVVGDGPDRERLEALAGDNPDILFVGHRSDVREWLGASDIYIYCGAPTDGTPVAAIEAAASGLGLIGFEGDPGVELVGKCGGHIAAGPEDVTEQVIATVASTGGQGVAYVRRHHGREQWLNAYESIIQECLA